MLLIIPVPENLNLKEKKMPRWVDRWYVKSHSSDMEYTVSRAEDGYTWGCGCPAWKFQRHKLRDGICKHIREVQSAIEGMTVMEELNSQNYFPTKTYKIRHDDFFKEEEFTL